MPRNTTSIAVDACISKAGTECPPQSATAVANANIMLPSQVDAEQMVEEERQAGQEGGNHHTSGGSHTPPKALQTLFSSAEQPIRTMRR